MIFQLLLVGQKTVHITPDFFLSKCQRFHGKNFLKYARQLFHRGNVDERKHPFQFLSFFEDFQVSRIKNSIGNAMGDVLLVGEWVSHTMRETGAGVRNDHASYGGCKEKLFPHVNVAVHIF